MRLRNNVVILLIFLMMACRPSTRTDYKLSDEQLAHLLFDVQLAEVTIPDIRPEHQDSIKLLFDKRLEEIYKLSIPEIKKELDQLQADPEKLKWVVGRTKEMADSIQ